MSLRSILGTFIGLVALLIAASHAFASTYSLYWRFRWFDMPVHFLGGLFLGSAALWLITYEMPPSFRTHTNRFVVALIAALLIGALWELFEYSVGITKGGSGYWLDTVQDFAMGGFGAGVAYLIFKRYVG